MVWIFSVILGTTSAIRFDQLLKVSCVLPKRNQEVGLALMTYNRRRTNEEGRNYSLPKKRPTDLDLIDDHQFGFVEGVSSPRRWR